MNSQQQAEAVDELAAIVYELRGILAREATDREIVRDARLVLADWYASVYPHLFPGPARPQLRVIQGGGEGTGRLF